MSELKPRITENGIDYILVGDYYIPDLKLPEERRPTPNTAPLICGACYNTQPEDLLTMA